MAARRSLSQGAILPAPEVNAKAVRPDSGDSKASKKPSWLQRLLPSLRSTPKRELEISSDVSFGRGGHGSVVSGRFRGRKVAVKVLPMDDSHTTAEVAAFKALGTGHANVVSAHPITASSDKRRVYLPLEPCDHDLLAYTDTKEGLEEFEAAQIFLQVVRGLRYMHGHGVYHMDIKPENVLLREGVPKIADLGTAVITQSKRVSHPCGTPIYGSPESVAVHNAAYSGSLPLPSPASGKGASVVVPADVSVASSQSASLRTGTLTTPALSFCPERADVWSLAVSLFVCVTGFFPWKAATPDEKRYAAWVSTYHLAGKPRSNESLFRRIFGKTMTQHGTPFSPEFMDLMRRALHPSEAARLTLRQFESHPFFKTAAILQAVKRSGAGDA